MAEAVIVPEDLGVLVAALADAVTRVSKKNLRFKPQLAAIKETTTGIMPILTDIQKLNGALNRPNQESEMLISQLKIAENLVLKCVKSKWYKTYSYSLKLCNLNESLRRFFQITYHLHVAEFGAGILTKVQYPLSIINRSSSFRGGFRNWQKGDFLGSGSYGIVYKGFNEHGAFFAVKEVSLLDSGTRGKQSIEQEIYLLSQLHHENIVRYLGTDTDDGKIYIFLELVTQGSLANIYQKFVLRDSHVSAYTKQILHGLNYLHEQNVVHRDIKCANILVDASGSVKLADFGLAKAIGLNGVKSCKGTPYWMAPEVVHGSSSNGYGLAADIWSLGCTVLEMLTRKIPYSHLEEMQALFKIGRGERPPIPDTLSMEAQDFILRCLQVNQNDRPTAAQLLDHPFIQRQASMNFTLASPHYNAIQL